MLFIIWCWMTKRGSKMSHHVPSSGADCHFLSQASVLCSWSTSPLIIFRITFPTHGGICCQPSALASRIFPVAVTFSRLSYLITWPKIDCVDLKLVIKCLCEVTPSGTWMLTLLPACGILSLLWKNLISAASSFFLLLFCVHDSPTYNSMGSIWYPETSFLMSMDMDKLDKTFFIWWNAAFAWSILLRYLCICSLVLLLLILLLFLHASF